METSEIVIWEEGELGIRMTNVWTVYTINIVSLLKPVDIEKSRNYEVRL